MNIKNETRLGVLLGLCLAVAGCGGGGFGESVAVPQETRTTVSAGMSAGKVVSFPDARAFNIAQAARTSTGNAVAEAEASDQGSASCRIQSDASDSASGEFQLGHVIYNDTAAPLDVSVLFEFDYAFEILDRGPESRLPDTVGLKVFVQDSDQTILHRRILLEQGDGLTAWKGAGRSSPWFNFTLQPHLAYNLVLAGKVAVEAEEEGKPVEANIEVSNLRVEVSAKK